MKTTNSDVRRQYETLLAHLPDGMSLAESEWKGDTVPKYFSVFCDHCRRSKAYSGSLLAFALPNIVTTRFVTVHGPGCPNLPQQSAIKAALSRHQTFACIPMTVTKLSQQQTFPYIPMTVTNERNTAWSLLELLEKLVLDNPSSLVYRATIDTLRDQLARMDQSDDEQAQAQKRRASENKVDSDRVKQVAHAAIKLIMDGGLTVAEQNAALEHVEFAVNSAWETALVNNERIRQELEVQHKEIRSLSMFTPTEQLRQKGLQPSVV